jgi:hypothetical protein
VNKDEGGGLADEGHLLSCRSSVVISCHIAISDVAPEK